DSILVSSASESSRFVSAKLSHDCMWPFLRSVFFFLQSSHTIHICGEFMGRSNCTKGGVKTLCIDPFLKISSFKVIQCKIMVWSQPCLNSSKVTENTCMQSL
uniref:Uncharacterized protein n=1 Tax=Cyprinus carpio TaxID=7962 RepID=A0A8C1PUS4_CYPCA